MILTEQERGKLLEKREELMQLIKDLNAKPLSSKSEAAARFRAEDLNALATKVVAIDKKLGRLK